MFKNYFKIVWRNFSRNKMLSFINVFGLAIGMAFAILIGMWIQYERSFDTFNENIDRLAIVRKHTLFNNEKGTQTGVMLPLYYELKKNYPEIKRVTRMDWGGKYSISKDKEKFSKRGHCVDPDFLQMFTFAAVKGDLKTALNDPTAIILTESLAQTLFGTEDPMGKTVQVDNEFNKHVTAVIKDVPKNSTFQFDFLAPYEFLVQQFPFIKDNKTNWGNNFLMNLVEVKEGASIAALSKKIGPLVVQKNKRLKNQTLILQPLKEMHLYGEYKNWVNTGGAITYVRLFGIIGIFVLLIACINFMNLATARSEKRAREVGIRKAIGSQRSQLVVQFLSESMFTAFVAFLLSVAFVNLLLPLLKEFGFENIQFDLKNISLLGLVLIVCLFTGLVAGSYPAWYLSSFLPVKVLKGIMKQGSSAVNFRKVLVVSQFAISSGLIISTIIIVQQINYAKDRSTGYNYNNLITIDGTGDLGKDYQVLKQELQNTGYIDAVAKSSSTMTGISNSWSDFSWDGKDPNADISLDVVMTEWDYEKAAGLQFIAGRPFSQDYKTDSNAVILNEAALRTIGYKDPIGKTMKMGDQTLTIVGVIKDVLMQNPFDPVKPGVILFNATEFQVVLVRLKNGADLRQSLAAIEPIVRKHNASRPFEYSFVDEEFGKKFATENQVARLAGIFAGLAIFISCLGLFGLAMFMAERRAKEISVRKVLGASVASLWMLLSREFVWLVLIACILASPLTFWLMNEWLQQYDYRISISGWIFAIAGVLAIVIALLTVSIQAIKAALANPVKRLRSE
ncbi:MAG: ABC transporter permease [Niastella sp.]|nr:ABC transporter permease [Niastella sp.]